MKKNRRLTLKRTTPFFMFRRESGGILGVPGIRHTHPARLPTPRSGRPRSVCMIGVLQPQSPHKANNSSRSSSSREDSWLRRSSLKPGASGERYFAGTYYDQQTRQQVPQDDRPHDDQLPSASSPTLLGECAEKSR